MLLGGGSFIALDADIQVVTEPGTGLSLLAGWGALVVLARRRLRSGRGQERSSIC